MIHVKECRIRRAHIQTMEITNCKSQSNIRHTNERNWRSCLRKFSWTSKLNHHNNKLKLDYHSPLRPPAEPRWRILQLTNWYSTCFQRSSTKDSKARRPCKQRWICKESCKLPGSWNRHQSRLLYKRKKKTFAPCPSRMVRITSRKAWEASRPGMEWWRANRRQEDWVKQSLKILDKQIKNEKRQAPFGSPDGEGSMQNSNGPLQFQPKAFGKFADRYSPGDAGHQSAMS